MSARSRLATMSIATSLNPPSGMMTSAYRLLGSTNSRCIGRTVLRYWSITDSNVRPRSCDVALQPPQQPQVGVGVDVDLDVHLIAQPLVGEDEDALDQDDRLRIDVERLGPAVVQF